MHPIIPSPSPQTLLPPLLASLPSSSASPSPPEALLPLLSPILRQRLQYLSATSQEPYLPLLTWNRDPAYVSRLEKTVQSERFEPHPASGEVEIDWDDHRDVSVKYERLDIETLHAIVTLRELGVSVKLLWCEGEADSNDGPSGWRIAEVLLYDDEISSAGHESIGEAEGRFRGDSVRQSISKSQESLQKLAADDSSKDQNGGPYGLNSISHQSSQAPEEDDDDDYWAQYDSTPARTPAQKHSPAPPSARHFPAGLGMTPLTDEDAYYARYASVQPALDDHDPDEASAAGPVESSLNTSSIAAPLYAKVQSEPTPPSQSPPAYYEGLNENLVVPRPASSASGEETVARLEREASRSDRSGQSDTAEVAVKQHIGTSVKSLYRLARAAGIERAEFDRLVRTELDMLGLMEVDD